MPSKPNEFECREAKFFLQNIKYRVETNSNTIKFLHIGEQFTDKSMEAGDTPLRIIHLIATLYKKYSSTKKYEPIIVNRSEILSLKLKKRDWLFRICIGYPGGGSLSIRTKSGKKIKFYIPKKRNIEKAEKALTDSKYLK